MIDQRLIAGGIVAVVLLLTAFLFTSAQQLTSYEKESLLFMAEEEKLARDVYLYLFNLWGDKIFYNIANSEQRHMDVVEGLLNKYSIPYTPLPSGQFNNAQLQQLYNELTQRGSISLEEALKVGALIEEVDIEDLDERLRNIDKEDIRTVYCNLKKGSANHLRAFTSQLEALGVNYLPQVLSTTYYQQLLNGTVNC